MVPLIDHTALTSSVLVASLCFTLPRASATIMDATMSPPCLTTICRRVRCSDRREECVVTSRFFFRQAGIGLTRRLGCEDPLCRLSQSPESQTSAGRRPPGQRPSKVRQDD